MRIKTIRSLNYGAVRRYFDNPDLVMEKLNFPGSKIINVDETGVSAVQKLVKIFVSEGQKEVGAAIYWGQVMR